MALKDRSILKNKLSQGAKPNGTDFENLLDSFWHKSDQLDINNIGGLSQILAGKLSLSDKQQILNALQQQQTTWQGLQEQNTMKYNDSAETLVSDVVKYLDKNTRQNLNYRKTTTWIDGSAMTDAKVDGVLYIKKSGKYYYNAERVDNRKFNIDDFSGNDDCVIFENAIAFLKTIKGGVLNINRNLNFTRNVHITEVYNITIEGIRDADSSREDYATTIHFLAAGSSLIIEKFNKLKIRNLKFSDLKGVADNKIMLELFNGYDFNLSDLSLVNNTGLNSRCISLGRGEGVTCAFLGEISNISTVQHNGGVAIYSDATNTSLTFSKCYARGGSYTMCGTVYSSMINCATDGSHTNGYLFKGKGASHLNSFSLVSCGAEVAKLSAIKVESGVVGLSIVGGFHSGANKRITEQNLAYAATIGSLLTTEITDVNHPIQSILIENPTIILPVGLDIFGGLYTGDVLVVANFQLLGGVGGDADFIKNNFILITSNAEIPNVTVKAKMIKKYDFCRVENHLVSSETNLSGTVAYLYPRINGAVIDAGFINNIVVSIPQGYTLTTEGLESSVTLTNGLNKINKKVTGQFTVVAQHTSTMSGKLKLGVDVEQFKLS